MAMIQAGDSVTITIKGLGDIIAKNVYITEMEVGISTPPYDHVLYHLTGECTQWVIGTTNVPPHFPMICPVGECTIIMQGSMDKNEYQVRANIDSYEISMPDTSFISELCSTPNALEMVRKTTLRLTVHSIDLEYEVKFGEKKEKDEPIEERWDILDL